MTRKPSAAKLAGPVLQPARPYQQSPAIQAGKSSAGGGRIFTGAEATKGAGVKHDPTVKVVSHTAKGGFPDAGLLMVQTSASKGGRLHGGQSIPYAEGDPVRSRGVNATSIQNQPRGGFPVNPSTGQAKLLNVGTHLKNFEAGGKSKGFGSLPSRKGK
jgi:hypothetical protein